MGDLHKAISNDFVLIYCQTGDPESFGKMNIGELADKSQKLLNGQ